MSETDNSADSLKKPGFFARIKENQGFISFSASLLCIIFGFLVGFIMMLIVHPANAFSGLWGLISGGFSSNTSIAQFIYQAAPIMLTGLSVAFAFKVGLFNIGAPGQYIAGGVFALVGVLVWNWPWYAALLLALIGGAFVGMFPGLLKSFFNVNEVLSAIMLNWITLISAYIIIPNIPGMLDTRYPTHTVALISSVNPNGVLPSWGLNSLDSGLSISIFIGILVAVICWVIISKTTFGFELKSCGLNKDASKYAGINDKRNIILSFVIAGALAGLGGAMYYLAPATDAGYVLTTSTLPADGFTGISVSLLAANNPIACIFSALFVSYLTVAGEKIQSLNYAPENVSVIIGIIVYFASFALFVRQWLAKIYSGGTYIGNLKKLWNSIAEGFEKFGAWTIKLFTGKLFKKIEIPVSEKDQEINSIAGNGVDKCCQEDKEEITKKTHVDELEKTSDKIVVEDSPTYQDIGDYNPDDEANSDISQLRRKSVDKKVDGGNASATSSEETK